MRYAPIRGVVWRSPQQAQIERQTSFGPANDRREYASETFRALAKLLDADEYESMLAHWRLGHRDIWMENGCVMSTYTPPSGV